MTSPLSTCTYLLEADSLEHYFQVLYSKDLDRTKHTSTLYYRPQINRYNIFDHSLLDVGVQNALDQSGFDEKMFLKRGGKYQWSKKDQELDW